MSKTPKHIVIATIGSLGDIHPCLAIALELKRRGHLVTMAAAEYYRSRIEALSLGFQPMRPHLDGQDRDLLARCEDPVRGVEILFREVVLPHLRDSYQDLLAICADADLLLAGEIVYAAPLVAEKLHLRWASIILSPSSFLSAYDPSVLANVRGLIHLRKLGRPAYRALLNLGRFSIRHWWKPVRQLRRSQGLGPSRDPLFVDKFSPQLVLALFSRQLAAPQPDWPPKTLQPGFLFYDQQELHTNADPAVASFLAAGEAPVIFTLGSTVVHNPGNFFAVAVQAARELNQRALLIGVDPIGAEQTGTGPSATVEATISRSTNILAIPYAPYSLVFPHASVIVHQGGSGTTGQAMRAGKPMLIVPFNWDQPDNGARIQRLGVGLTISRQRYTLTTAIPALRQLLEYPGFTNRASAIASRMQSENPLTDAVDAIESLW